MTRLFAYFDASGYKKKHTMHTNSISNNIIVVIINSTSNILKELSTQIRLI